MSQPVRDGSHTSDYVVSRTIPVAVAGTSDNDMGNIEEKSAGILKLELDRSAAVLKVTYDAATTSFSQVLSQFAKADIKPVDSWWFRLKAGFYDFTDQNMASQAHARRRGCCNRIPPGA